MGKKRVLSEGQLDQLVMPASDDMFCVSSKLLGFDRVLVKCKDSREGLCRIRGKIKKHVWIRESDVVLVSPWEFQSDRREDEIWRYTRAQADMLRKKGLLSVKVRHS